METQQVLTGNNVDAPNQLLQCTSEIVASHLRRVAVQTTEISNLIVSVHQALSNLPAKGEITTTTPMAETPASRPISHRRQLAPPTISLRKGTRARLPVAASKELAKPSSAIPACDPAQSVFDDYIICLIDGRKLKTLTRHIKKWNLTPTSYREKWGLPADYPMTCRNYSELRSKMAKDRGLGKRNADDREDSVSPPVSIKTHQPAASPDPALPVIIEPVVRPGRGRRPKAPPAPISTSSDHPSGVVIRRFEAGASGLRVKRRVA